MQVADVVELMRKLAPEELAADWDNVGLQVGDPKAGVEHLVVTLELTAESLSVSLDRGADMIVVHHPVLFQPAESLREDRPQGRMLSRLINEDVAVYASHTNLDSVDMGPSGTLAQMFELQDVSPLVPVGDMYKIAIFVPAEKVSEIRRVLGDAGAGQLGNYSHCSFYSAGEGAFLPEKGAEPAIGEIGSLTHVQEARLEAICPGNRLEDVIAAVRQNHPYEEPAIDVYPLANEVSGVGMGRLGTLPEPASAAWVARQVARICGLQHVRLSGDSCSLVSEVAVCGGSGEDLFSSALQQGADIFVSGDISHHAICDMKELGLTAVDAGHRATEQPAMRRLADRLDGQCSFGVSYVHLPADVWTMISGPCRD